MALPFSEGVLLPSEAKLKHGELQLTVTRSNSIASKSQNVRLIFLGRTFHVSPGIWTNRTIARSRVSPKQAIQELSNFVERLGKFQHHHNRQDGGVYRPL